MTKNRVEAFSDGVVAGADRPLKRTVLPPEGENLAEKCNQLLTEKLI